MLNVPEEVRRRALQCTNVRRRLTASKVRRILSCRVMREIEIRRLDGEDCEDKDETFVRKAPIGCLSKDTFGHSAKKDAIHSARKPGS